MEFVWRICIISVEELSFHVVQTFSYKESIESIETKYWAQKDEIK